MSANGALNFLGNVVPRRERLHGLIKMPDENPPEAVGFDLDGLMINTEQIYDQVGDELLVRRGKKFTAELKDLMMGRVGAEALRAMVDYHGLNESVESLQAESDAIFEAILPDQLAPMPGLIELLKRINAEGMPSAIATSSRRRFVDQVLSLLELPNQFQFILSAENVQNGKPNPEIYCLAAERFGIPTQRMVVLEDSQVGCRAAVASGAITVAVPGPHSQHHDFEGTAFVATSLADSRIYDRLGLVT